MKTSHKCMAPMISLSVRNRNHISVCANSSWSFQITQKMHLSQVLDLPQLRHYRAVEHVQVQAPPSTCLVCIERNSLGIRAQRNYFNELGDTLQAFGEQVRPEQIRMLDLNLSNVCNLKCRMCSQLRSSTWSDDQKKLSDQLDFISAPQAVEPSLLEFDLEKFTGLQFIILKGGEPLFDKASLQFLQQLADSELSKNASVTIFTNGVYVQKHIELLKKIKRVNLIFSFEGTGELYSYIRGGHDNSFEAFHENVRSVSNLENIFVSFMYTPQAYNVFDWGAAYRYITETVQPLLRNKLDTHDLKSLFGNILHQPEHLAVNVWPDEIRLKALHHLEKISDDGGLFFAPLEALLKKPQDVLQYDRFVRYTKHLDAIRGENIFAYLPELQKTAVFEDYQSFQLNLSGRL